MITIAKATACRITMNNKWVIASEKPNFDEEEFNAFLAKHGVGYFLRDETSKLDCVYFPPEDFLEIYMFESGDTDALFRNVIKIDSI